MSELINKYTEEYSEFLDALVQHHSLHLRFLDRQSPLRTKELRKGLRNMRILIRSMEELAQQRKVERSIEWNQTHRVKKED